MACQICGRFSCEKWMHGLEEQQEYDDVAGMNEFYLRREVVELRREVKELKDEIKKLSEVDDAHE